MSKIGSQGIQIGVTTQTLKRQNKLLKEEVSLLREMIYHRQIIPGSRNFKVKIFDLDLDQVLWLIEDYHKRTGEPAENIEV